MPFAHQMDTRAAARMLDIKITELYQLLRNKGVFIREGKNKNQPKHRYIERGYFNTALCIHNRNGLDQFHTKVLVTTAGLSFIRELIAQQEQQEKQSEMEDGKNPVVHQLRSQLQNQQSARAARDQVLRLVASLDGKKSEPRRFP